MKDLCPICSVRHYPKCPQRRWPMQPLIDAIGGADIPARLGSSGEAVAEAIRNGAPDRFADRWATRCGLHPAQVWPDWFDAGLTVVDRARIEGGGWRTGWLHDEYGAA